MKIQDNNFYRAAGARGLELSFLRKFQILRGRVRGIIFLFISVKKFLNTCLFRLRYPLPTVVNVAGKDSIIEFDRRFPVLVVNDGSRSAEVSFSHRCLATLRLIHSLVGGQPAILVANTPAAAVLEDRAQEIDLAAMDDALENAVHASWFLRVRQKHLLAVVAWSRKRKTPPRAGADTPFDQCLPRSGARFRPIFLDDVFDVWGHRRDLVELSGNVENGGPPSEVFSGRLEEAVQLTALAITSRARPPIIQVVNNQPKIQEGQKYYGLGDILLGAILVHQESAKQLRPAGINWDGFSGGDRLGPTNRDPSLRFDERRKVPSHQINSDVPVDFVFETGVFTNRRPKKPLSSRDIDFLFRNGVSPTEQIVAHNICWLHSRSLLEGGFSVVHVRFGDSGTQKEDISNRIQEGLVRLTQRQERFVVMSDRPELLGWMRQKRNIFLRDAVSGHSGLSPSSETTQQILADFFLMKHAKKIYQLSRYAWGSGFSEVASGLFGVPLEKFVTHRRP